MLFYFLLNIMKLPIILSLFLFSITACHKTPSARTILIAAETMLPTSPDSAQLLLSEIKNSEQLTAAEKADYAYLTGKLHFQSSQSMTEDSLLLYALDYYEQTNQIERIPFTAFLTACYYKWNEDEINLQNCLEKGIRTGIGNKDSIALFHLYDFKASEAAYKKNYYEAIEWIRRRTSFKPIASEPIAHYIIGLYYSRIGKKDSASFYMQKSVALYEEQGNKEMVKFTRRNYADQLSGTGSYEEALALNRLNQTEYGETDHLSFIFNFLGTNQTDSAQLYIEKFRKETGELYLTAKNMLMAAQLLIDQRNGKTLDMSTFGQYNDSVYFSQQRLKKIKEEKIDARNRLEEKTLLLSLERQRIQLWFTWGLLITIIVAFILFLILHKKRKQLAETREKQDTLEQLLKEACDENNERNLFFKKTLLQQLGFIRIVANRPTPQNQDLLKAVSFLDNSSNVKDQIILWDDFYKLIDSVYNQFFSRLNECYKEKLNEKEIQLCCLLYARFSTKEISVITGQKTQTIYQRKTVIRQKLQMDEKEDIITFLSVFDKENTTDKGHI